MTGKWEGVARRRKEASDGFEVVSRYQWVQTLCTVLADLKSELHVYTKAAIPIGA